MERAICEQCGHRQPNDWKPGDLCIACGSAVRREVRCAWCAEWIPAVRYCRSCGCEVASPEQYGAARMLKNAGVDRFSLLQRLRDLDPEQALNLARIYNAQLAVVDRRVDELRLCEKHLLQNTFSRRLEETLIPTLPVEKDRLAELAAGPRGPGPGDVDSLLAIAESSPIAFTRTLAAVALVRLGHFEGSFRTACDALYSDDGEVALEAALAFAHWRARLSPYALWQSRAAIEWGGAAGGIDRRTLANVAGAVPHGSPLRPWAAAAVALASHGEYGVVPEASVSGESGPPGWLREELLSGLTARDPDLRFTCAMALGEDGVVIPLLQFGDAGRKVVARRFLSRRSSPALADLLADASEDVCREIVNGLQPPLPPPLAGAVMKLALRRPCPIRERCVRLLLPVLDEEMVGRLVRTAVAEKDRATFRLLLGAERLPAAGDVVRAILKAGLARELSGALHEGARHIDFGDGDILRLAEKGEPEVAGDLVEIAYGIIRGEDAARRTAAGRFLVGVAFSSLPGEVRERAWSHVQYGGDWDVFSPEAVQDLFGGAGSFAGIMVAALERPDQGELQRRLLDKLSEQWLQVAEAFAADRFTLERFVCAVARLAQPDGSGTRRDEAVRLLTAVAIHSPAAALPPVAALLRNRGDKWECRDIPARLLAGFDALAPSLAQDRKLAGELAGALVRLLWSIEARDLLTRIAIAAPSGALPVVAASLRDHAQDWDCPAILANFLAGYATISPWLARDSKLAVEFSAALAHVLGEEAFPGDPWIPVVELLTRLAQDQEAARKAIAERMARHLEDRHRRDDDLGKALDGLASALGAPLHTDAGASRPGTELPPPGDELDHVPILPDAPLKTLSEYVAFLKAMGASPDPMAVLGEYGMTQETFVACLSQWGEALGSNDRLAMRYGQMVQQ